LKIRLLPSRPETDKQTQLLTSFLINDSLAVDAGNLGFALDLQQQERVRHIVLTHTHMDHIALLPIFIDEVFSRLSSAVQVYALPEAIATLRKCVFNDAIWPNFEKIMLVNGHGPALEFLALQPKVAIKLAGLSVTPIPVNHTIPTVGMLVEDDHAAVIYSSDTYVTNDLWEVASATKRLKAIFVDVSYPNELEELAGISRHLTPQSLGSELKKLKCDAEIHCVHIKPVYRDKVIHQLEALRHPRVFVAEIGKTYQW
jgi:cAMP phosphodiesterase